MKDINIATWKRRSHFAFFSGMDYPHFNVCFDMDVSGVRHFAEKSGLKFFYLILFLSSYAANQVPEMKTRIRGDRVVEHDRVHPAFTIMGEDHIFNYCRARFDADSRRFFKEVDGNIEAGKRASELVLEEDKSDDEIYMTSLPWITFTSLQHPIHQASDDSIPRLSWGRFVQKENRWVLPYSFQAHHGLVDGYHAGLFAEILQDTFAEPELFVRLS